MRAVFLLLLVAAAILAETNAQQEPMQCGPNAVFSDCVSACEPSCDKPHTQICTDECIRGCRCEEGFLLNSKNECVLSRNC